MRWLLRSALAAVSLAAPGPAALAGSDLLLPPLAPLTPLGLLPPGDAPRAPAGVLDVGVVKTAVLYRIAAIFFALMVFDAAREMP